MLIGQDELYLIKDIHIYVGICMSHTHIREFLLIPLYL